MFPHRHINDPPVSLKPPHLPKGSVRSEATGSTLEATANETKDLVVNIEIKDYTLPLHQEKRTLPQGPADHD